MKRDLPLEEASGNVNSGSSLCDSEALGTLLQLFVHE